MNANDPIVSHQDACKNLLATSREERMEWLSFGAATRLVPLSAEDRDAIMGSGDPALKAVQDRLTEHLAIDETDRDAYLLARRLRIDGEIEFDSDAIISQGPDNGAYVSGWIWVDFSGTPLDKSPDGCADEPGEEQATRHHRSEVGA